MEEQTGLTLDEMRVFVAIGASNYAVFILKIEEGDKWCIKMRTIEGGSYYIQKQRGGIRTFQRLEDAIRTALNGFPGISNLVIYYDDKEFALSVTASQSAPDWIGRHAMEKVTPLP